MDSRLSTNQSAIVVFDIDGVVRDVGGSYRRALADTVEHFTGGAYRPSQEDIDALKTEGIWNNDWEASQELIYRYFEAQGKRRKGEGGREDGEMGRWGDGGVEEIGKIQSAISNLQSEQGAIALDYDQLVAFFQARYRGPDPTHWTGYICQEPLLLEPGYLELLTQAGIRWGFFSGATRGSAAYVLERRLGLNSPVLVAMEDAPGKPDPTGLLSTVEQLEQPAALNTPVIYVGDTVADMYTVEEARQQQPDRKWIAVGVLPPHVQVTEERSYQYLKTLEQAGAEVVFWNVQELTPEQIGKLIED